MKMLICAMLAMFLASSAVFAEEFAIYTISTSIEGMKIPNQKPGVGDRSLVFRANLDPEDADTANAVWYDHLELLLGPDDVDAMRGIARDVMQRRR